MGGAFRSKPTAATEGRGGMGSRRVRENAKPRKSQNREMERAIARERAHHPRLTFSLTVEA